MRGTAAALTDAPGPRAMRRQRAYTVVGIVVVAAGAVWTFQRLASRGQLDADRWDIFTQWGVQRFYLVGLWNTLRAALVAAVFSFAGGLVLAFGRLAERKSLRWLATAYVEAFRAAPLVLLMFFSLFALPEWGINFVSPYWAVVLGLVAYNSAVLCEIYRAGVAAIPRGQTEAALSIGLTRGRALATIVLPQALRAMAPAIASQLIVLLKDTSLGALIAYEELLRRGQITGEFAKNPLQALFVAGLLYAPIVFALNRLSRRLEVRRVPRSSAREPVAAVAGA